MVELVFDRVPPTYSIVLLGDVNAHMGNDGDTWRGVIRRNGLPHLDLKDELLMDFCTSYGLSTMNTMLEHKAFINVPGTRAPWAED